MTTDGVVGAALDSLRRLHRPLFAHAGLCQGRAGRRRDASAKACSSPASRCAGRRVKAVVTDHGHDRLRDRRQRRRHLGEARSAKMAGVAIAAGAVEHQYIVTEKKIDATPRHADLPRSRPHLLPEARRRAPSPSAAGRRARRPAAARACRSPSRRELFPAELRPLRADHARRGGAPADPERGRHPHADQRPDPGLRRRRAGDGPRAGARQFLRRLRLHRGHRGVRRRRQGDGASGSSTAIPAWICGPSTCAASPATRRTAHYLAERSSEAYGDYYSIHWPGEELTSARGGTAQPAPRHARGGTARCSARRPAGSGPHWFARAGTSPAIGDAELRGRARLVRRRSGASTAPCASAAALIDQSSFSKFEITGPGALAALQRIAANDLDRPDGRLRLHPALQRARRHRGRPHDHAARAETGSTS